MRRKEIPTRKTLTEYPGESEYSARIGAMEIALAEEFCMVIREGCYIKADVSELRSKVHDNPHFSQHETSIEIEHDTVEFYLTEEDHDYITDAFDGEIPLLPFDFNYEESEGVVWECTAEIHGGRLIVTAEI